MNKLSGPAFVYVLVESIINIYLLITGKLGVFSGLFKLIFIYLWVLVLQYLYITLGWRIISWVLVLLPIITNGVFLVKSLNNDATKTTTEKTPIATPEKTAPTPETPSASQ